MFCLIHYKWKKRILLFSLMVIGYSYVQGQSPNIIYIMTDDMGYGDLSGYGRKDYSTPNLDKLASQGIKFVNAYSAAPLCTLPQRSHAVFLRRDLRQWADYYAHTSLEIQTHVQAHTILE